MNENSKWLNILNFAFHILNISYPCYWSVLSLLVSYWSAWQALMHIHDDSSVNQPTTIRIMKVPRQSPMRMRDVACKCAVNYPHHEGA
jgi:hypothetical protein